MPHSKELEAWFEEPANPLTWRKAVRAERYASGLAGGFLLAFGLSRKSLGGALLAGLGTGLLVRGIRGMRGSELGGRLMTLGRAEGIRVHRTITVLKDPSELFERAHGAEEISRPMRQVQFLRDTGPGRANVIVRMPRGGHLEWDVRLERQDDSRRITWTTQPGASVRHSGTLFFRPAPKDRGTEVHVVLDYELVPMAIGVWMARLSGREVSLRLADSLRRYKQIVECGEIATTIGQPSGRMGLAGVRRRRARRPVTLEITIPKRSEARP